MAHPTGVVQALATTCLWFSAPLALGWSENTAVFWYLAYCTFISFATQFTLAYQNRRAEAALEQTLRNLTDLMKLDVAMAEQVDRALDELYVATQATLGLAKEIHEDTDPDP